jgi:hypothetical protein
MVKRKASDASIQKYGKLLLEVDMFRWPMPCELQFLNKCFKYMLVNPQFVSDSFRVAIEQFKYPISASQG